MKTKDMEERKAEGKEEERRNESAYKSRSNHRETSV
jgi:hypothetical protein